MKTVQELMLSYHAVLNKWLCSSLNEYILRNQYINVFLASHNIVSINIRVNQMVFTRSKLSSYSYI